MSSAFLNSFSWKHFSAPPCYVVDCCRGPATETLRSCRISSSASRSRDVMPRGMTNTSCYEMESRVPLLWLYWDLSTWTYVCLVSVWSLSPQLHTLSDCWAAPLGRWSFFKKLLVLYQRLLLNSIVVPESHSKVSACKLSMSSDFCFHFIL